MKLYKAMKLKRVLAVACTVLFLAGSNVLAVDLLEAVSSGNEAVEETAPENTTRVEPVVPETPHDPDDGTTSDDPITGQDEPTSETNDPVVHLDGSAVEEKANPLNLFFNVIKNIFAAPDLEKLLTGRIIGLGQGSMKARMKPWGDVIGTLDKGDHVVITGREGNWYIIDYEGARAYLHKGGVVLTGDPEGTFPKQETSPLITSGQVYKTGDGYLNIRNRPWGDIVGRQNEGALLVITGEDGDWYVIKHKGSPAYAHKGSVRLTGQPRSDAQPDPGRTDLYFNEKEINAKSPRFNSWIKTGLEETDNLDRMPYVENIYGRKITPEEVVKTLIWMESRGTHTRDGKVLENAWGFTGFMQLGEHFGQGRFDPEENIRLGIDFLNNSCLNSATPPANKFQYQIYNPYDAPEEMLIKAMVGYNRGPYGTTELLTGEGIISPPMVGLDRPWNAIIAKTPTTGHNYMQEGVDYGLMAKASLGLPFSEAEKNWIKSYRRLNSEKAFEEWRDNLYKSVHSL